MIKIQHAVYRARLSWSGHTSWRALLKDDIQFMSCRNIINAACQLLVLHLPWGREHPKSSDGTPKRKVRSAHSMAFLRSVQRCLSVSWSALSSRYVSKSLQFRKRQALPRRISSSFPQAPSPSQPSALRYDDSRSGPRCFVA